MAQNVTGSGSPGTKQGWWQRKPAIFCHKETAKLSMVTLTAHKSSLLCPGCWKQAAFYRGRSDIGISSEDPLTAQALSSWKSEGSCAGLVSAGCSGHTLLRCSGRHAVCFCDSLLAVPLISCINWMQIISPNISWTRPRSVWAKPSYSRYPESQSCVSTVLCLVSRDEEQRMLPSEISVLLWLCSLR